MSVTWSATALPSGRYSAVERSSDVGELTAHFTQLRSHGSGYLEVRRPGRESPQLTLSFRGDQAVVHVFDHTDGSALLAGDGTASADTVVDIPVMNELAAFSGEFVLSVDHAWARVRNFIQTGAHDELGEWSEL